MSIFVKVLILFTTALWNCPAGIQAKVPADVDRGSMYTTSDGSPRQITMGGFTYIGSIPDTEFGRTGDSDSKMNYVIGPGRVKWFDAYNLCEEKVDGKLVSIETKDKEAQLNQIISKQGVKSGWISARYDRYGNKWVWTPSRAQLTYTNLKSNHALKTDERLRIVYVYDAVKPYWETSDEFDQKDYICEISSKKSRPQICQAPISLAIVLDGSWSIEEYSPGGFKLGKEFAALLAEAMMFKSKPKLTFLVFGWLTTVVIPFTNKFTWEEIMSKINGAKYPGAKTYTHVAIQDAVKQLGDAPNKILVVITEGISSFPNNTKLEAEIARKKGILTYAVEVGNYDKAELDALSGDISRKFTTIKFQDLSKMILKPLVRTICKAIKPKPHKPTPKMRSMSSGGLGPSMRSRTRPKCKKRKFNRD